MQIALRNVTKKFDGRTILQNVDMTVEAGETVALVGPSGGGKSTLLRCLNGLNTFDVGEIQVGEHRLQARPNDPKGTLLAARPIQRLLGMIFQDFQLFPHQSALENIMEAPCRVLGIPKAQARARAMELLRQVGLGDRAAAMPRELSGGQKQRVAIARALAMEPKGLLCDEITSALDPERKHDVLDVLFELKQKGLTLIMVTHEIGFARKAADRVMVLAEGTIIESGPPSQVIDAPVHERTKQFLSRVLG